MKTKFIVENGKMGNDNVQINIDGITIPDKQIYLNDTVITKSNIKPVKVYKEGEVIVCETNLSFKQMYLYPSIAIKCNSEDVEKVNGKTIVKKCNVMAVMLTSTPNADDSIKTIKDQNNVEI